LLVASKNIMLLEIPYIIALTFALLFAYYDLKKGEVENWVSHLPLALGIMYWFVVLWLFHENYLFNAIGGAILLYFVGLLLYYFAGLGGADVRFLAGLAVLLPATPQTNLLFAVPLVLLYNFFILLVFLVLGHIVYHLRDNNKQIFANFKSFCQKNFILAGAMTIYAVIYLFLFIYFNLFAFLLGFILVCSTLIAMSQQDLFTAKINVKTAKYANLKGKELSQAIIKNGKIIAPAWSKITPFLLNLLKQEKVNFIFIKSSSLPVGIIFPLLVIFTYFFGAIGF